MKRILSSPITLIVSLVIFLGCSYWIVKNVKLEDLIGETNVEEVNDNKNEEVAVKNGGYEIRDNNVVNVKSNDTVEMVIKGDDIDGVESLSDITVSPDGKKMCFLVHTVVPVWLYLFDTGNGNLKKVDLANNCYWSPDSRYIAYNNYTTDVSDIRVLVYDTEKGEIKDPMKGLAPNGWIMQCSFIDWVENNEMEISCIRVSETAISLQDPMGKYFINVLTGDIRHNDLPD